MNDTARAIRKLARKPAPKSRRAYPAPDRRPSLDATLAKYHVTRHAVDAFAALPIPDGQPYLVLGQRICLAIQEWLDTVSKRHTTLRMNVFAIEHDARQAVAKQMERHGWAWHCVTWTAVERDVARMEQRQRVVFALARLLSLLCCGDAPDDVPGSDFCIPYDSDWSVPLDTNFGVGDGGLGVFLTEK